MRRPIGLTCSFACSPRRPSALPPRPLELSREFAKTLVRVAANPPGKVHRSRNRSMSLVVVGSLAIDQVVTPKGERECLGGSASYFAYVASFFGPVRLVGVVGEDFPKEYLKL